MTFGYQELTVFLMLYFYTALYVCLGLTLSDKENRLFRIVVCVFFCFFFFVVVVFVVFIIIPLSMSGVLGFDICRLPWVISFVFVRPNTNSYITDPRSIPFSS